MRHLEQKTERAELGNNLNDHAFGWQYRFKLINELATAELRMVNVKNWRVMQYVYGISELNLIMNIISVGETPEHAVKDHWDLVTNPEYYYCTNSTDYFKWNDAKLGWDRFERDKSGFFVRVL